MWQPPPLSLELLCERFPRRPAVAEMLRCSLYVCLRSRNKSTPECRIWYQYLKLQSLDVMKGETNFTDRGWQIITEGYNHGLGIAILRSMQLKDPSAVKGQPPPSMMSLIDTVEAVNPRLATWYRGKPSLAERNTCARLTTALIVGLCDGYFRLRRRGRPREVRFFHIARRLPLELQQVLAMRLNGLGGIRALPKETEWREILV